MPASARPPETASASPRPWPVKEALDLSTRPVLASAGQIPWPSPCSSRDRQRAGLTTGSGQFLLSLDTGVRLDRPGLDGLRDTARARLIERVWCLSPDRLARIYAYQVILLDELAAIASPSPSWTPPAGPGPPIQRRFTDVPEL
jgi:hypothetical protein